MLPWLLYVLNRIVFATVIPYKTKIGKDVLLGYQGLGIVIHKDAIIGDGVQIGTCVSIGGRSNHRIVPRIEANVIIGSGAKIIGPVTVGHHAQIGANAVVISDVPAYGVAVGVPAKTVKINYDIIKKF